MYIVKLHTSGEQSSNHSPTFPVTLVGGYRPWRLLLHDATVWDLLWHRNQGEFFQWFPYYVGHSWVSRDPIRSQTTVVTALLAPQMVHCLFLSPSGQCSAVQELAACSGRSRARWVEGGRERGSEGGEETCRGEDWMDPDPSLLSPLLYRGSRKWLHPLLARVREAGALASTSPGDRWWPAGARLPDRENAGEGKETVQPVVSGGLRGLSSQKLRLR